MDNNYYYIDLDKRCEKMLKTAEVLGSGHNGIVYSLPNKKVIKIFKEKQVCDKEYSILKKTGKSKYFPKTYEQGDYYIVRDYVGGERLDHYIKRRGFRKEIGVSIIKLMKEFKRLKFKKIDIRCKDLYIDSNFKIMVIDPKNNYSKNVIYPRHLMKGLNNLGVLNEFLEVVYEEYNEVYELWSGRMKQYLESGIK
ncbi:protein kinase [Clostridium rectalis]|uniref:protein kinase n=1 Tax=Clostridium rectalis TaxID=2040295 RepID=UPI000F62F9B2